MVNSAFYVPINVIINRITRIHKNKSVNELDIIEWAVECEVEYLGDADYFVFYKGVELFKERDRFYLPCLVYRVIDVYDDSNARLQWSKGSGNYIFVNDKSINKININYIGIPVDEEGNILLHNDHLQAIEAFIVERMYYEDFILGKLHPTIYQEMKLRLENELLAARGSLRHVDSGRLEMLNIIQGNMIPKIGRVPLHHLYNINK